MAPLLTRHIVKAKSAMEPPLANLNWQPIGNQKCKIAKMKKPGRFRTGLSH